MKARFAAPLAAVLLVTALAMVPTSHADSILKWGEEGVEVHYTTHSTTRFQTCSDGSGGAIYSWFEGDYSDHEGKDDVAISSGC